MHSDKCFSGAWATVWTKWDGLPCGFWQGKLQLILWLETWVQKVEKHWAVNQSQSAGLSELRKSRRGRGGLFPFAYRIHKTSLFLVSSACSVCRCRATVMLVHVMELQNDDFSQTFHHFMPVDIAVLFRKSLSLAVQDGALQFGFSRGHQSVKVPLSKTKKSASSATSNMLKNEKCNISLRSRRIFQWVA